MKSCRNCKHSTHMGDPRPDLVCPPLGLGLAKATLNDEENKKADSRCRDLAARCDAYVYEGEMK